MRSLPMPRRKAIAMFLLGHTPLACRYLKQVLASIPHAAIFTEKKVDSYCRSQRSGFSVAIVDASLLAKGGGIYLRMLRSCAPNTKLLAIGADLPSDVKLRQFKGLDGFITYDKVARQLVTAIHVVCEKHLWLPTQVIEQLARFQLQPPTITNAAGFTPREKLVVTLLSQRLSNKEISNRLGISERTVKFHIKNIFDKVGVRDRYSLLELSRSDSCLVLGKDDSWETHQTREDCSCPSGRGTSDRVN